MHGREKLEAGGCSAPEVSDSTVFKDLMTVAKAPKARSVDFPAA